MEERIDSIDEFSCEYAKRISALQYFHCSEVKKINMRVQRACEEVLKEKHKTDLEALEERLEELKQETKLLEKKYKRKLQNHCIRLEERYEEAARIKCEAELATLQHRLEAKHQIDLENQRINLQKQYEEATNEKCLLQLSALKQYLEHQHQFEIYNLVRQYEKMNYHEPQHHHAEMKYQPLNPVTKNENLSFEKPSTSEENAENVVSSSVQCINNQGIDSSDESQMVTDDIDWESPATLDCSNEVSSENPNLSEFNGTACASDGERSFECIMCKAQFSELSLLKNHLEYSERKEYGILELLKSKVRILEEELMN